MQIITIKGKIRRQTNKLSSMFGKTFLLSATYLEEREGFFLIKEVKGKWEVLKYIPKDKIENWVRV